MKANAKPMVQIKLMTKARLLLVEAPRTANAMVKLEVSKKMVYAQNEYQNEYLQQQSKAVKKKYIHGGEGQQESSRCKKTEARFPQSQSSAAVFGPEVDPISGPQGVKENDGPPGTGNGQGLRFHPVYFNPPTSNSNKESILGLFGQSNSENPHHQIESTMGPIIYV